jgi:hypothetical protein
LILVWEIMRIIALNLGNPCGLPLYTSVIDGSLVSAVTSICHWRAYLFIIVAHNAEALHRRIHARCYSFPLRPEKFLPKD